MKLKRLTSIIVSTCIVLSTTSMPAFALDNNSNANSQYLEYHNQINFDNLDINISNNKDLNISCNTNLNLFEKLKAKKSVNELNEYLDRYPDAKNN